MNILWFRNDLRLQHNPALNAFAKAEGKHSVAIYILEEGDFTETGLGSANKVFLHGALLSLKADLKEKLNLDLVFFKGDPLSVFKKIAREQTIDHVFWNRRYFPTQTEKDAEIKKHLKGKEAEVTSFKSSLVCEPWEGVKGDDTAYLVYSPFFKHIFKKFELEKISPRTSKQFTKTSIKGVKLEKLDLLPSRDWDESIRGEWDISEEGSKKALRSFIDSRVENYSKARDFPGIDETSKMSPYLRFGLITPLQILTYLDKEVSFDKWPKNESIFHYVKELYWREYSYHLLYYYPKTVRKPLKEQFSNFPWLDSKKNLKAWQKGMTGYPIVDAGMRQLWHTGWMHNRVRMIVGSFLTKHLLTSWTHGAQWFEDTLVDGDLASNTFGWQWISGCGADAAPYFRIFNPILQSKKFAGDGEYIRKWVPELKSLETKWLHEPWEAPQEALDKAGITLGDEYPEPIVEHAFARRRALQAYEKIKK